MVSGAGETGLRHNSRHKSNRRKGKVGFAQLEENPNLASTSVHETLQAYPEFSFFEKWGYPLRKLTLDPRSSHVWSGMRKLWPRLTPAERQLYLQTAERIAKAEKAKRTWNPKESRERYARLAKNAVAAAKLVRELSLIFPPPWVGEETMVGEVVFRLASFISGSLSATFPSEIDQARVTASVALQAAKKRIARKTGGMRWELLRDLVWLASGRKIDERDVRRYLEEQRSAKNPAEAIWQPNWPLIWDAMRLGEQWRALPEVIDKLGQPEWVPELEKASLDSTYFIDAAIRYLTSSVTAG